jgi:aryl-alcohol dehydrogenase-like predicted oxidoreductase
MADDDGDSKGLTRRRVLTRAAGIAAGVGVGAAAYSACQYSTYLFLLREAPTHADHVDPAWGGSRVKRYRALGRTGIEMSDISFGGARIDSPEVVARAVERGINYFDTSPDYSRTGSEQVIGQALRPHRSRVFIASKFCTAAGHLPKETPVAEIIRSVEASLRRLQTDYLDVCIIHECDDLDRLMAPSFHEAFDRLKEQGKVRFLGVSSHTPNLERVMRHAVDSGRFQMLLVAYNFKNWPDLTSIFHDAKERGVGVVAMKTLKGARATVLKDFEGGGQAFSQAAFKWVLSNPDVSGLVISIRDVEQIDEYLYASGEPFGPGDQALLERYDERVTRDYCRPGCGRCLDRCPRGVPVDDLFRYAMYSEDYGWPQHGRELYAALPADRNAAACASCPAPCEAACPFEIPIRDKLARFHHLLAEA